MWYQSSDGQRIIQENIPNFTVSTVPADGPSPINASIFAGTWIIKFGHHTIMYLAIE